MGSKVCAHCGSYEKLSQNLPTLKTERENTLLILKSEDTTILITVNISLDLDRLILFKKSELLKTRTLLWTLLCVIFFVKH